MNTQHLFDDYSIALETDEEAFRQFFQQYQKLVFAESPILSVPNVLTDREKEQMDQLAGRLGQPYTLRLYILKGGERIGWFQGIQRDRETFYMKNTGIFPGYRNKGIYTALLPRILDIVRQEGFQMVASRHKVTNNAILVPKLKAGFIISSFELSDVFGLLVHLTYYFNEVRRKVVDFRVGYTMPDDDIKRLLGF